MLESARPAGGRRQRTVGMAASTSSQPRRLALQNSQASAYDGRSHADYSSHACPFGAPLRAMKISSSESACLFDDAGADGRGGRLQMIWLCPATYGGPFAAGAVPGQRTRPARAASAADLRIEASSRACDLLDPIERIAEQDAARLDHRHLVGDALHFGQQVRREQHGAAFVGDRADDRAEDVAADDRIEAGRRLIEQQQLGPVGEGDQQAGAGPLALGKLLDFRVPGRDRIRGAAARRSRGPRSG